MPIKRKNKDPSRCGKKRKLNSRGAYSSLKDKDLLEVEEKIDKYIAQGFLPLNSGLFLTENGESLPVFGPIAITEKVFSRTTQNNPQTGAGGPAGARIVLTKDNYGHRGTGLGGMGATLCEAIDIVAGSLSCEKTLKTGTCISRANFATDGARIYLTERGDIQNYFALGEASKAVSISSQLKSGIGIKADHTLVIGRELVRIVAGLSAVHGSSRLVNQNGPDKVRPRIELAATTDKDAQPAVLGNALEERLDVFKDQFGDVYDKIQALGDEIIRLKYLLAGHFHTGAGLGAVITVPDPVIVGNAMSSLGGFLNVTTDNVITTMNMKLQHVSAHGVVEEESRQKIIKGSRPILSNTVFIGN